MRPFLITLLRVVAVAIAVAGAIDPSIRITRATRPEVAVVASGRLPDPALVDRVAAALEDRFDVARGASFGAAATVSVGDALPPEGLRSAAVGFAVTPAVSQPFVRITAVDVPASATAHARVPVRATVNVRGASGTPVAVSLRLNGVEIDRQNVTPADDDHTGNVALTLLGDTAGPLPFHVVATVAGSTHRVDRTIMVRDRTWQVLSVDRRPSWSAGFVRRALESDPRFEVTARVATSRGVSSTIGAAPAALSPSDLDPYDAVLVGGLDAVTTGDVQNLQGFMRERGGTVVLLPDDPDPPPALRLLSGIERWSATATDEPAGTPAGSEVLAPSNAPLWSRAAPDRSVRIATGKGELLIAGAMDTWRYRPRDPAAFDRYWQVLLAGAADRRRTLAAVPVAAAPPEHQPSPDERALVAAWASAHSGRVFAEADLTGLGETMASVINPPLEERTIHPMRSAWWMLPFGLLLGLEWWSRRRSGLK